MWQKLGGTRLDTDETASAFITRSHGHHKLSVWSNQPHVWQVVKRKSVAGKQSIAQIVEFMNEVLA